MRMRRTILGAAALMALIPAISFGTGPAPCGPTYAVYQGGGCGITYTTQMATGYHTVTRTVEVPCTAYEAVVSEEPYEYRVAVLKSRKEKQNQTEYKWVAKPVPYTYYVCELKSRKEKQNQTEYKWVARPVPYTYYVCELRSRKEKQNVTEYTWKTKQVPYTYYEYAYETGTQKQTFTRCVSVPRTYETLTPVCQNVAVCTPVQNGCGHPCGYAYSYRPVTSYQKSYATVCETQLQAYQVDVPVTTCKLVAKQGTYTAYEAEPHTRTVDVDVSYYEQVRKEGTYTTYECQGSTREVEVDVWYYEQVKKEGTYTTYECQGSTREVEVDVPYYDWDTRKDKRQVVSYKPVVHKQQYTYCELVPYQCPVQVPCYTPMTSGCGGIGWHAPLCGR